VLRSVTCGPGLLAMLRCAAQHTACMDWGKWQLQGLGWLLKQSVTHPVARCEILCGCINWWGTGH
jgi:hypothetical protein